MTRNQWIGVFLSLAVVAVFLFGERVFFALNTMSQRAAPRAAAIPEAAALGFVVRDIVVGTGALAQVGNLITVHYVGTLESGAVFDTSLSRGTPFQFVLGAGEVISGWDKGVIGMRVGGRRTLIIPPALGYGAQAIGPIPANSTLIFEIELLEVQKPQ